MDQENILLTKEEQAKISQERSKKKALLEEVLKALDHFKDTNNLTNEDLAKFCEENGITRVMTIGELEDTKVQKQFDEQMKSLLPKILAVVSNIKYVSDYITEEERAELDEHNKQLEQEILEIVLNSGIDYKFVETAKILANNYIDNAITGAFQMAHNMSLNVLLHLAKEKFGGLFNLSHTQSYINSLENQNKQE